MKHLAPEPVPADDPQGVSEADACHDQSNWGVEFMRWLKDNPTESKQDYPD